MNVRGRWEDFMEEETFHLGLEESARVRQAGGEDSVRDTIHKAQTAVDVAVLSRVVTPLTCVSFFEWSIAGRTLERGYFYFQKYHLPPLPRLELSHCHQIIAYRHHAGLAIGELKVGGEFKSV